MVYASEFGRAIEHAKGYGWSVDTATYDHNLFMDRMHREIDRLSGIYARNVRNAGVEIIEERAEFVDAHALKLMTSGRTVTAQKILIATGGSPIMPKNVEGIDLAISSNEMFHLDAIPGHIVIVGGGFAFTTLRSLINYMIDARNRSRFGKITVIYGARNPGLLIYKDELEAWGKRDDINLNVTVDKGDAGWKGREGFVPTVCKEVAPSSENAVTVICGPPIMIRFTLPVFFELGFSKENIITSLEMRMKCGIGKCGRCNVGEKYVCKDGPVFSLAELDKLIAFRRKQPV